MDLWLEIIILVIPSAIAIILAIAGFALKMKKDSMTGMSKELSELVLKIVDAAKDKNFTQREILDIIKEAEDVINEGKKLLEF
uniref:Holin n=1 Tax=viral metagenome TaxID=1070528 RepID=A0A6M3J2E9_9ZZZZ